MSQPPLSCCAQVPRATAVPWPPPPAFLGQPFPCWDGFLGAPKEADPAWNGSPSSIWYNEAMIPGF